MAIWEHQGTEAWQWEESLNQRWESEVRTGFEVWPRALGAASVFRCED